MKPQLSVCMVISSFHPIIGGAERQAQLLAVQLMRRGVKVSILTRRYPGLASRETVTGIPVYRIPVVGRGHGLVSSAAFVAGVIIWLVRHRHEYDIVHAHQALSPAIAAALAKLWTGKPVVVKVACSGPYGDVAVIQRRPLLPVRLRLLGHVDRFLALSEESVQELASVGLERQTVLVCNGVDTRRFAPQPHREKEASAIFVGRLTSQKGVDVLFRAWRRALRESAKPLPLLVVGDGPERESLESLAEELGLEEHIRFAGSVEEIERYYHLAQLFILPSRSEGLPNALLEAMACGLPAIATCVGGIPDVVVDGETGLLVPPDDEDALADAIERLLHDLSLRRRMAEAARRRIEAHYSIESVADQVIVLYQKIIEGA
jgi:glycosyltransferase involved in cell wall biosynthesis